MPANNDATPFNISLKRDSNPNNECLKLPSQDYSSQSTPSPSSRNSTVHCECAFESNSPDGGWGWVVVFAAFMINLIADGITHSFGVMYVEFLNFFKESKGKTAWIGSLFMGIPLLAGPLASALADRFGCRKVTIAGALLAALGFILSSLSESIELLFLTFGIMSGFGLALCYVAAIVIVAYYFEKKRSFATGLAVSGSGIGTFIFAPLTQYLLGEFQWRGTILILAGFFLNIVVCGALMRDLEWTKKKYKCEKMSTVSVEKSGVLMDEKKEKVLVLQDVHIEDITPERLCSSLIQLPTFLKNCDSLPPDLLEMLSSNKITYEFVVEHYAYLLNNQPRLVEEISAPASAVVVRYGDQCVNKRARANWSKNHTLPNSRFSTAYFQNLRIHRNSITHRGAMLNIHRYHLRASSCPDIYRNSMITISQEDGNALVSFTQDLKEIFLDMIDISYFKNVKFLLFCISNLLLYIWYDVPYIYIADNAINNGIDEKSAYYLISIIGILNTIGEIILGYVGDNPWVNTTLLYAIFTAICGAVLIIVPLVIDFYSLCAVAGTFGFAISANYSLTSIIIVDLITLEKFTNAYGLLLMVQGVANLIGPPLAGWLYDITGTYDMSFYMAGLWIFISGAMMFVLPFWKMCRKWNDKNPMSNEEMTTQKRNKRCRVEKRFKDTTV
uniref:Major facilitator superfamily (MFS) profile domain-containing protein n=1 Tax=Strigamia maritima TaxID=126957 RepID=T1IP78_STRMM